MEVLVSVRRSLLVLLSGWADARLRAEDPPRGRDQGCLAAAGYPVSTTKLYVTKAQITADGAAISLPQDFPAVIPLGTLARILVLTLLVIRGPLRPAIRIQPGAALRYQ
jgi:hypothetical protein